MILILSNGNCDKSANDVFNWINHYQGDVCLLNSKEFPVNIDYYIDIRNNGVFKFLFLKGGKRIDLTQINVIWNWRWEEYGLDFINKREYAKIKKFMHDELLVLSNFLFSSLNNKYWFGHKYVNKITVLTHANRLGLNIPNTLVAQSKELLYDFIKKNKKVIIKPLSNPIFFSDKNSKYATYTKEIYREDIDHIPFKIFPLLVQQCIDKEFEVRCFYLSGTFYSAAIISQQDPQTKQDFRNYNHKKPNRVIPYTIPENVKINLIQLMDILLLDTGSIDLIYSNGEYYFLEVNPVGQFDMISTPCNYNLDEKIAMYLIKKDKNEKET
jgi:ATP-GRASP peptide maturase of grasp-with-spasm system